jgi:hypothetical protein
MSAEQVKQSFVDAASGDWSQGTACRGLSLEWTRKDPGAPTRWARFEFHEGWLVAMRFHTDGRASAAHAEQTVSAVRQDRPYEGGTPTILIARGCSTHAAEADQSALSAVVSGVGAPPRGGPDP